MLEWVLFKPLRHDRSMIGRVAEHLRRAWNWETDSLWVWVPIWAISLILWGGFLA